MSLVLKLNQKVPDKLEGFAVGGFVAAIKRDSPELKKLVKNNNPEIVFKNEEDNGDDRLMTKKLNDKVNALAALVKMEFPGLKLRITEAWDDGTSGHAKTSRHLEGRAVDITTSDRDPKKLGRLAGLAVEAGFEWVFFEDKLHVHASVSR
jgi:hypothetical protein